MYNNKLSDDFEVNMETIFSKLKVNNEFELCCVYSEDAKNLLEQALLKARISYYMNYPRKKFFDHHRFNCIFCVNESNLDEATEIVDEIFGPEDPDIRMIAKKNPVDYF